MLKPLKKVSLKSQEKAFVTLKEFWEKSAVESITDYIRAKNVATALWKFTGLLKLMSWLPRGLSPKGVILSAGGLS